MSKTKSAKKAAKPKTPKPSAPYAGSEPAENPTRSDAGGTARMEQADALDSDPTPGVGRLKNATVEKAARAYKDVRDDRMELTKKEGERKAELAFAMKTAGLKEYRYGDQVVVFTPGKENVKVKTVEEGSDLDGDGQ